jgi:hypothetical protein
MVLAIFDSYAAKSFDKFDEALVAVRSTFSTEEDSGLTIAVLVFISGSSKGKRKQEYKLNLP